MQLTWKTLPCGLPPRSPKAPSTGGKHPRVLSYACKPQQPACGTINIFLKKGKGKKNEKIKRNISYNEINGKHSFMFCFPGKGIFFLSTDECKCKIPDVSYFFHNHHRYQFPTFPFCLHLKKSTGIGSFVPSFSYVRFWI